MVVGRFYIRVNLSPCRLDWACYEGLIDRTPSLQYPAGGCCMRRGQPERVPESSVPNYRAWNCARSVAVQVPGYESRKPRRHAPATILQYFCELKEANTIASSALQVQVVHHEGHRQRIDLGYEGNAATEPLLKRLHAWQKPPRAPEFRLAAKPDYAWIG